MTSLRSPFRTPQLSLGEIGWLRPLIAVLASFLIPAALLASFILTGDPSLAGPPKDGSAYTLFDHASLVLGALGASTLVSWITTPLAVLALRMAALHGWAGWGSAILAAQLLGLPTIYLLLRGEAIMLLPYIAIAIAVLGCSVWAVFWGLVWRGRKRSRGRGA